MTPTQLHTADAAEGAKQTNRRRWTIRPPVWELVLCLGLAAPGLAPAETPIPPSAKDPHVTDVGFFDLHICNWPDRPNFIMALFSTFQFDQIEEVSVLQPDGTPVGKLDLSRYRVVKKADKPEKRVFITFLPLPRPTPEGWYHAHVRTRDGRVYLARDYVRAQTLAVATEELSPPPNALRIPLPTVLSWKAIPGARYYKVYLFDQWEDGKQIFETRLLTEPRFEPPPGLLRAGGSYLWRIHARDINEDPVLGDFNHGSLTGDLEFSVAD